VMAVAATSAVSTAVAALVAATMAAVETVVGQRRGTVMEVVTEVGAVIVMPSDGGGADGDDASKGVAGDRGVTVVPVIVVPVTVMPMIKVGQGCRCRE
jgi:bisphosphoglycerate-independent phosphoglycerate mutase (AlkP superfamily)